MRGAKKKKPQPKDRIAGRVFRFSLRDYGRQKARGVRSETGRSFVLGTMEWPEKVGCLPRGNAEILESLLASAAAGLALLN
jgi:hypothetical protein